MSFFERYIKARNLPRSEYVGAIIRECSHLRYRLALPLILKFWPDYIQPDIELVEAVGRVRRLDSLKDEIADFYLDYRNRTLLRKTLKIRVSPHRVRALVESLLATEEPTGRAPGSAVTPAQGAESERPKRRV